MRVDGWPVTHHKGSQCIAACNDAGQVLPCRPDYEACAVLAERVLNRHRCARGDCALGSSQPRSAGTFFALTGLGLF